MEKLTINHIIKDIRIQAIEEYAHTHGVPIIEEEGRDVLLFAALLHQPRMILEIGGAIGYSAVLLHAATGAYIQSIERNEERSGEFLKTCATLNISCDIGTYASLNALPHESVFPQIMLYKGDAFECITLLQKDTSNQYDFIFIDAAKAQYQKYFEHAQEIASEHCLFFSDNLLFHGYTNDPEKAPSKNVRGFVRKLRAYCHFLETHEEYTTLFLKEGDGIALTFKKNREQEEQIRRIFGSKIVSSLFE